MTDWRSRAACLGHDPDLWFPQPSERPHEAIAICRTCPVIAECADFARRTVQLHGVWGGRARHKLTNERVGRPVGRLKPIEHGTYNGYHAHYRRGEEACDPCKRANTQRSRRLNAAAQRPRRATSDPRPVSLDGWDQFETGESL
ncbi:WhiB family transcriptional regulator [Mycobacterium sp. pUA109]|uniref:WhiB family transcriptional regulator n=1 Tax=Mycobacterium sp. pUA109 TaxID=3238982 RepID=UPI00351AF414